MSILCVVSWDKDDAPEDGESIGWWGGFFEEGMRWQDYLDAFDEEVHPRLEAARASAVKHRIRVSGGEYQYAGVTPVFSDGRYFSMTQRSWGDFMAAVWSEEESKDYSYLDFYV